MNIELFTDKTQKTLQMAQTLAMRLEHQQITPLHL